MRWLALVLLPLPAWAEAVVALRPLAAGTILTAGDVTLVAAEIGGAIGSMDAALGQQLRRSVAAGRPIQAGDIAAPLRVDRNQIIALRYQAGAVTILTEGRALDRGAEGDVIAVMNLTSRSRLTGRVMPDGTVTVTGGAMP